MINMIIRIIYCFKDQLCWMYDDDPDADLNGLYAECNGDICYMLVSQYE